MHMFFARYFMLWLFLSGGICMHAQTNPEDHVVTPKDGQNVRREALEKKQLEYQQGLEKHQTVQDKKTRKRMRKMERQSRKLGKPLPWYKRWFRRKKRG